MMTFKENWQQHLLESMSEYKQLLDSKTATPEALLEKIKLVRILCAVKRGDFGVDAVNRLLADKMIGNGILLQQAQHGLPFIIRSNNRSMGLWNGDCGVFHQDDTGTIYGYMPAKEKGGAARKYDPYALPEWDPAFSITIHKSQGSEYESVVLVLPELRRRFITWELVYTGITRAKENISLVLPEELVGEGLPHARRVSGLLYELYQR